nr:septum formation family protein [Frigoribacterium sp. CFBP 13707]
MTRRERRLAEAAGVAVPPAQPLSSPPPPPPLLDHDGAPAPSAATVVQPAASAPVVEPSFTQILGIVPLAGGAAERDPSGDPGALDDVPGEVESDAGRDDPVVEEVPLEVERLDAETLDAPGADDAVTRSWSLGGDDVGHDEAEHGETTPADLGGSASATPPAAAASGFPEPYRPPVPPSAPAEPVERARTAPPEAAGELPGLSFGAGAGAGAESPARASSAWVPPTAAGAHDERRGRREPAGRLAAVVGSPRGRLVLFVVGAAVVVVLALVALFFLGRSLFSGDSASADPAATSEPASAPTTVTADPAPVEEPAVATGPLPAGSHPWSDLQGGECFSSFEDAWQQDYDVVDCAAPHVAQLASQGALPGDAGAPWPGSETLQNQMSVLCTSPEALDLTAAGAYRDVQFVASWPVTAADWDAGDRTYSCFVTRSSGEPFTTSLAPTAG